MHATEEHESDVIIIGAGAAGLMCAFTAGGRGRRVTVLEHGAHAGAKIRISGGGRCNFTNVTVGPESYLSDNPRFCISALSRFTPGDFLALVRRHGIAYHEREAGQLFCTDSARDIITMLLDECRRVHVDIRTRCTVSSIERSDRFRCTTARGVFTAPALVIATGGISIPKMGATDFGYRIARQFGIPVINPKPGLVPFVLGGRDREFCAALTGNAIQAELSCGRRAFTGNLLFTHRGISGPPALQISSYWNPGETVRINMLPGMTVETLLERHAASRRTFGTALEHLLPKRLVRQWNPSPLLDTPLTRCPRRDVEQVLHSLQTWTFVPESTEGFSKAEVTVGGVDTSALSSKTMECRTVPGLYFVGEVMDVTGWLGGYNFQWAWSSGWAAGQAV